MFLLGTNLNPFKRVLFAIQNFDGVGPYTAARLLSAASIHRFCHVKELSERQVQKLKELLQPMLEARKQAQLRAVKESKNRILPILPQ